MPAARHRNRTWNAGTVRTSIRVRLLTLSNVGPGQPDPADSVAGEFIAAA